MTRTTDPEEGFFLVDVEAEGPDPSAFQRAMTAGVDQRPAAGVDDHDAGFIAASAYASIRWRVAGVSGGAG
jgi:hypothetical protein